MGQNRTARTHVSAGVSDINTQRLMSDNNSFNNPPSFARKQYWATVGKMSSLHEADPENGENQLGTGVS